MVLYENTKVKVWSPDEDTYYFDIVTGVLQGDTLASYLFIIWLDYIWQVNRYNKKNGFKLAKKISRRYPVQTIMEVDYDGHCASCKYTCLSRISDSLERTAGDIGLHDKADKIEYMCFNQRGDISRQKGCPLKPVDKFTYLKSSVSSS